ncbi:MAG: pyridoxal-phosphate dependent enzyme [Flavobacteriales bacterium]|nr:pyridoxal-phosphate dependent enzyme [Flavobacteriales bacterium]
MQTDRLYASLQLPTPLTALNLSVLKNTNIRVFIKRDDLIHPEIAGNKFRKLKYNLAQAQVLKKEKILTFGGPFSNHIAATAKACDLAGIPSIGIIRGEEADLNNPTLHHAIQNGMNIVPVSRSDYDLKEEMYYLESLHDRFGDIYIFPEGGANYYGINGCGEIIQEIEMDFDYFCVAVGSGTTITGLSMALKDHQTIIGFPAVKGGEYLRDEIEKKLAWTLMDKEWASDIMQQVQLETRFHFGGFARYNKELLAFMNSFLMETGIQLDFVYTAKMMYGLIQMIQEGKFKAGSTIVVYHSGGVQGNQGINS